MPAAGGPSQWQAVPIVTRECLLAGNRGGEGCQAIQNFAIDSGGAFLMMATNVGGLYRSLNGGADWEPANVGYSPRGASALAIDPNNSQRVIAVGANSHPSSVNGLWLSTDQASSWKPVLLKNTRAAETYHDSVAFDPASRKIQDAVTFSAVAYWLAYSDVKGGLWKSADGGETWRLAYPSLADGIVKVDPLDGTVYVATPEGFYRSTDGGADFTRVLTGPVLGLDVVSNQPGWVYINRSDGVWLSTDRGLTFAPRRNSGLPSGHFPGLRNLKVSPADPRHMLLNDDKGTYYRQAHYYSTDGGDSWAPCNLDSTGTIAPPNGRPWLFIWSPVDPNLAWACGGDFISRSTDGGAHFAWANNGFNGLTCAGLYQFNPNDPGLLLLTSQDSNSVFTDNAAASTVAWRYLDVSGKNWGGFNYGGYALSQEVLLAGNSSRWDAPATLMVSTDGGGRWSDTGLVGNHTQTACGDPANPAVAFWDNYRTTDGGRTWEPMPGCDGVFTFDSNPNGNHGLYGAKGPSVVESSDHGAAWTPVVTVPGRVTDLACDWKNRRLYIATGRLYQYDLTSQTLTDLSPRLPPDN
ncbi:MAG TPA: hypothetical protein VJ873_11025, partial [bacterium]|nr:hypothetical protein [bacterium]